MFFSIDRITEGLAMLMGEDGKPLEVPVHMLPNGAKEGDTVRYRNGIFFPAPEKTAQRRARVADMLALLLQDDDEDEEQQEEETDVTGENADNAGKDSRDEAAVEDEK